jgi:hypothetical protein
MTSRLAPVADRLAQRPESSAAFTPNLISAIRKWRPDFVIPADERIRRLVHRLVSSSDPRRNSLEPELVAMLLKSVGDSRHFDVIERKTRLLDFARAAGLPVAPSSVVRDEHGATEFAKECGYPVVIKRDFTWGGLGVAVCQQPEDVAAAMNQVRGARLFLQSDPDAFSDSCGAPQHDLCCVVERFIPGADANYALVALEGRMLAGVGARVIQTSGEFMPASVCSIGRFSELARISETLVKLLGYSGFAGCDFRISREDGRAYLLEFNPRPVPTSHLGVHLGFELCAALVNALEGAEPRDVMAAESEKLIALFPQEWIRDPSSPWLNSAYHDTPSEDPSLLRYLKSPAWLARSGLDRPKQPSRARIFGRAGSRPV